MNINFELDLRGEEQELLKNILEIETDNPPQRPIGTANRELADKISVISKAASYEYVRMILGQKIFTRGQDIKEFRLFMLIKYLFNGKIPDEQTITTLFQTTTSESKSLLRSVLAKYQYELRESINETIKDILGNRLTRHELEEGEIIYYTSNIPLNIVDEMNKLLSGINGALTQISKKRGALNTFEIAEDAYTALIEHFGLGA